MTNKTKGIILQAASLAVSVGVPFVATIIQFPLFINKSAAATVSGLSVLILLVCIIPFAKHIKIAMRSASIPFVWSFIAVGLFAIHSIVEEMIIVAVLGAISNWIGMVIYRAGEKYIKQKDEDQES